MFEYKDHMIYFTSIHKEYMQFLSQLPPIKTVVCLYHFQKRIRACYVMQSLLDKSIINGKINFTLPQNIKSPPLLLQILK